MKHSSQVAGLFHRLGQCAASRASHYADLAIYTLAVAVSIAGTYYILLRRDGQAESA